ncbi:helix-turn-helix domain-containing protein [Desulfofalx alkaliphila]|uniref:helix-turn-helix domain-containing protein n=1 Tax=Desulfofalx alkaliphila TaxID=105483 RepID=UPI0004E163AC|nr:helix-turn-helix transcriptional regulator [Desulfofalx alkaliphila]
MDIGKRICQLREQQGLSKNKLAKRSEVAQSHLSNIENGHRQPTFDVIERICKGLGITIPEFFNIDYQPNSLSSDLHSLINKTEGLRPSQQNTIKNILSIASNVAEDYKLFNQLNDNKPKSNCSNKSFIEILDLLDRKDTPLSVGGHPLSMEDRIAILEFLRDRVLPDEEAAAGDRSDMVIAASYQGDRFTQDPTPEDLEDIENAIKFAEDQEQNKKRKK